MVACSNRVYADWIVEAAVRSILVASILTLPLLGIAPPVVAQEGEIWYRVQIVQVRPEKLDDFTELYRDEVNPALQKAGVPWRAAWRTGQFPATPRLPGQTMNHSLQTINDWPPRLRPPVYSHLGA